MKVRAGAAAGAADTADDRARFDRVALFHGNLAEMGVTGFDAAFMLDLDETAIAARPFGLDDPARSHKRAYHEVP